MKVKIIIWALVLIWFISCSVPTDASDTITLENYKINIVFDRETFEFDTLTLDVELDPIAFTESLKVAPIVDSTSQDFNDFVVEGGMKSKYVQYDHGATHPIGAMIPAGFYIDSIVNIPDNAQFLWAQTDSMRVNFSVENNYNELIFDSLNIVILRKDVMYSGMPGFLNGYREVIDTTFFDFQPGTTKLDSLLLDKAWITDDMTLRLTTYNQGLTLTQPLDATQNLYFNVIVNDSKFHSAFADFNTQVDNQTDSYSRGDISEYGNIKLRSIILKDFKFSVNARNETDLYVEIDGQVDNFYELKRGEDSLVNVDKFSINPNTGLVLDVAGPYTLDSCKFTVNYENQSATVTHDSWGRALPGSPDDPYVYLDQNDSVSFYFRIESTDPGQDFVPFYEFDGLVENETIQISETTSGFTEDIDWDDWNGVGFNMLNLKAETSFSREDLEMDVIILDNFRMIGVKEGIYDPDGWVSLRDTTLYDFNNGILDLEELPGGNTFADLIDYRPDTIEYSANATMTFDGVLKYTDKLNLDLQIGTALEISITDSLVRELDVHEMDALDLDEGSEAISLKINSFVNNPPDPSDKNAYIRFMINLADSMYYDADSVQVLAGNIIQLVDMDITPNPDAFPNGYMLTDVNTGSNVEVDGILLDEDAVNMMIETNTYMQEVIVVKPEMPGGEIYLSDTGFIEVQTKISGEFKISTGDGE